MSIESLKEQARRHEQKEEWQKALDQYKKAIAKLEEEDQPDIGLYNRVADLFVRVGDLEEAVQNYNRAADLYMEAELPNNAIAVCKKIIRNVPDRHEAYLRMGQIRAKQGFLPDARTNFLTYAERMQQAGDLDESFRALVEFCDLAPDDVEVRIAVAEQMASHSRSHEAVEQLTVAYRVLAKGGDRRAAEVEARIRGLKPDAELGVPAAAVGAEPAETFTAASAVSHDGTIEAAFGEIQIGGAKEEKPKEKELEAPAFELPSFEIGVPGEEAPEAEAAPLPTFGMEEEPAAPLPTFGVEEEPAAALPTFGFEEEPAAPLPTFGTEEEPAAPLPTFGFEEEPAAPLPTFGFEEEPAAPLPTFGMEEEPAAPLPTLGMEEEPAAPLPTLGMEEEPAAPAPAPSETLERAMAEAAGEKRAEPQPVRPSGEPTIEHVRDAITHNPDNVELRQRMVELAYQSGDERVMVEAFLGLGETLQRGGQSARAKAAFQQVLQFDPGNAAAKSALGQAPPPSKPVREVAAHQDYVDLGALILGDEDEKTTRFVVAYEEPTGDDQADFAKMLSQFKEKVSQNLDADDVRAHYDLGTAYKEMGLLDEAVAEFQQALRASSSHLPTYEILGQTFMEMGKHEAAVRTLERALEVEFEIEDELIAIYYYLARAYETQGNREGALEFYDRVFSLDINFADVTERLRALR
jgi:tetratricopeptide (TPR) repeat protein